MATTDPIHEQGHGDHDRAYQFGRRISWLQPYPFTPWELSHLMVLRGRRQDGQLVDDTQPTEESN